MKIYTKGGDSGQTSLISGERVAKYDVRVEAYGTVDELSAYVAMLRDMLLAEGITEFSDDLIRVLKNLMVVEALMALGQNENIKIKDVDSSEIEYLEGCIDIISEELKPLKYFTIPGGRIVISQSHICRTVCRRAERRAYQAAEKHELSSNALKYLNRLSDYFYVLGRRLSDKLQVDEMIWIP